MRELTLNRWTLIFVIAFCSAAFGVTPEEVKKLKITEKRSATENGTVVEFFPPEKHHFNSAAPNKVTVDNKGVREKAKLQVTESKVLATFLKSLEGDSCQVEIKLFVCDEKNTYCLPKVERLECKDLKWGKVTSQQEPVHPMRPFESLMATGQFSLDFNKAKVEAQTTGKFLYLAFSAIWCPPCNQMEELVYKSPNFSKWSSDFLFVKIDADKSESWELKTKYKIKGYPTVIVTRADGEELGRFVGGKSDSFVSGFLKSMVKLKGKYEPSDYQRGLAALEREEFVKAQYHLISASRHWTAADPKRSDLLSAMIGVLQDSIDSKAEAASDAAKLSRSKSETQSGAQVQKEELQKLLLLALKWFPSSSESFARIDKLLNLVEESKDKTKISEALQLSMEVSKTWLRNMARHKENGVSRGDVYQLQAELKSKMGNLEGAKKLYKNAAEAYQASIKSSKQDEYRERGYNLERIYCLWKAGDFDRAGALYTQLQDNYPDDFTFFYQHAHMFKEQKKWDLVLEKSAVAQRLSYGDNKLRVSHLMAEALKNLDRKKESIKLIDSVLNEFHVPGTVSVRTTRYVAKLKNLRQEIETGN